MTGSDKKNQTRRGGLSADSIAENLRVASELREFQEKLAPLRAANRAEKAVRKQRGEIKTR